MGQSVVSSCAWLWLVRSLINVIPDDLGAAEVTNRESIPCAVTRMVPMMETWLQQSGLCLIWPICTCWPWRCSDYYPTIYTMFWSSSGIHNRDLAAPLWPVVNLAPLHLLTLVLQWSLSKNMYLVLYLVWSTWQRPDSTRLWLMPLLCTYWLGAALVTI